VQGPRAAGLILKGGSAEKSPQEMPGVKGLPKGLSHERAMEIGSKKAQIGASIRLGGMTRNVRTTGPLSPNSPEHGVRTCQTTIIFVLDYRQIFSLPLLKKTWIV
jgi:hypothetical protein